MSSLMLIRSLDDDKFHVSMTSLSRSISSTLSRWRSVDVTTAPSLDINACKICKYDLFSRRRAANLCIYMYCAARRLVWKI